MNLKRQLLLVGLMTLMLPWAGCEFIRETESALRELQQDMLGDTARAMASSLSQYVDEFPPASVRGRHGDRIYLHPLASAPVLDGYFDDWPLPVDALATQSGVDGEIAYALGEYGADTFLYVHVRDRSIVYASPQSRSLDDGPTYADRISLVSFDPLTLTLLFAAEAPGPNLTYRQDSLGFQPETRVTMVWQDVPGGYRIEARIPTGLLGDSLGLVVRQTPDSAQAGTLVRTFTGERPGPVARPLPRVAALATPLVRDNMRAIVTDADGWRIVTLGDLSSTHAEAKNVWPLRIYEWLLKPGAAAQLAEPNPRGRETQSYVAAALDGATASNWFRSDVPGRAVAAVATPIERNGAVIGALVLQQTTDAIISQTNAGLSRLINLTLFSTALVVIVLLGFATWLSRRIRHLSVAAEQALQNEQLNSALPSALDSDEIGDLSRSFSSVLQQLGEYNAYLRTLASKLSHELRTPLTIVTSSLENLDQEPLPESSAQYVARARDGADRLRRILRAMSEASRVEELMENATTEPFDLVEVLDSTVRAYRDAYAERQFQYRAGLESAIIDGAPELVVQMLDKLVNNAVEFSATDDEIGIELSRRGDDRVLLAVSNPGPPLPANMHAQLFDSMVSVRGGDDDRHLGLGLYVAKLIATGHGGRIEAENTAGGVRFIVTLPATRDAAAQDSR